MKPEESDVFSKVEVTTAGVTGRGGRFVLGGLAVFMAWALLVPLGSAVVAPATLGSSGRNQLLQHVAGGIVTEILASEGDLIEKGGVVVELDPAIDQAKLTRLRARHAVLKALRARLEAQKGTETVAFLGNGTEPLQMRGVDPLRTASLSGSPIERELHQEQVREFEKGRNEIAAQMRALADRVDSQRERFFELIDQVENGERQVALLKDQLEGATALVKAGNLARQQVWDIEARLLQAQSGLSELRVQQASALGVVGETEAEMDRIRMTDGRETSRQLTEVIAEVEQISDELAAAELTRRQSALRAPVKGYLVHLATTTVGGVVRPGEVVGEIVPADAPIEARARVAPNHIASVHLGQAAEMRISALNPRVHDRLPAKVSYVAADASVDERTGERYFEVRALVDGSSLVESGIALQPGMNGELYIEGESRTFATYMFQPFLDSLSLAFREVH